MLTVPVLHKAFHRKKDLQRPLSRNVRTAPSTPELESKTFHTISSSASTGHLVDMATNSNKRLSKSPTDSGNGRSSPPIEFSSKGSKKSKNYKFHKRFRSIPKEETVLNAYSCAYIGDILLQGYLYISPNWFCFYTKILGHEKSIAIPVSKVLNLTREKTAIIIPNAIGIVTCKDKYVFGSLMQRDTTYKLMESVWKSHDSHRMPSEGDLDCGDGVTLENHNGSLSSANDMDKPKIELTEETSGESSDREPSICSECGGVDTDHPQTECPLAGDRSSPSPSPEISLPPSTPSDSITRQASPPGGQSHDLQGPPPPQGVGYTKTRKALGQLVIKVQSMPRTSLLVGICSLMVLFLILSAAVMTYKIFILQAQIDDRYRIPSDSSLTERSDVLGHLYHLNGEYHVATVERFHNIIRANMQLLEQIYVSLKEMGSFTKSCSTTEPPVEKNKEL